MQKQFSHSCSVFRVPPAQKLILALSTSFHYACATGCFRPFIKQVPQAKQCRHASFAWYLSISREYGLRCVSRATAMTRLTIILQEIEFALLNDSNIGRVINTCFIPSNRVSRTISCLSDGTIPGGLRQVHVWASFGRVSLVVRIGGIVDDPSRCHSRRQINPILGFDAAIIIHGGGASILTAGI